MIFFYCFIISGFDKKLFYHRIHSLGKTALIHYTECNSSDHRVEACEKLKKYNNYQNIVLKSSCLIMDGVVQ